MELNGLTQTLPAAQVVSAERPSVSQVVLMVALDEHLDGETNLVLSHLKPDGQILLRPSMVSGQ